MYACFYSCIVNMENFIRCRLDQLICLYICRELFWTKIGLNENKGNETHHLEQSGLFKTHQGRSEEFLSGSTKVTQSHPTSSFITKKF